MTDIDELAPEDSFVLREYLRLLWIRKWSILAIMLIAALLAGLYARSEDPVYTSTANVLATEPLAEIGDGAGGAIDVQSERAVVRALPVTQCATRILQDPLNNDLSADLSEVCSSEALASTTPLPGLTRNLEVGVQPDSTVLTISYTDSPPRKAQATAQAFALAYVHYKLSRAQDELAERSEPIADRLREVNKSIANANADLARHAEDAASAGVGCEKCPTDAQRIGALMQEAGQLRQELLSLSTTNIVSPQVLAPAALPASPSGPDELLILIIGAFAGLAVGIAQAFLRESLDDRVWTKRDLERSVGVAVLGVIPRFRLWGGKPERKLVTSSIPQRGGARVLGAIRKFRPWRGKPERKLVTVTMPRSAASEAFRVLRTAVLVAGAQRGVKTILVSSPADGDGSAATAANLAVALANANKRVILVSGDLRKPRIHRLFGLDNDVGLSSALTGHVEFWEVLRHPDIDNLRVLPSGPLPSTPGELLQSTEMAELIANLREVSDFTLIDAPPILPVADAAAIASLVDGVLLVANAGLVRRSEVTQARELLDQVNAKVVGAVLNRFQRSKARDYSRRYYSYRSRYYYRPTGLPVWADGERPGGQPELPSVPSAERGRGAPV